MIYFILRKTNKSRNSRQAVQDVASTILASPEKPPEFNFRSPDHIIASENTGSEDSGRVGNNNDGLTFFEEGGFLLDDLLRASAEVLGKGIVDTTYKAYLDHGGVVIVKRLKNDTTMGKKKSFLCLISCPLEACLQFYMIVNDGNHQVSEARLPFVGQNLTMAKQRNPAQCSFCYRGAVNSARVKATQRRLGTNPNQSLTH